MGPALFDQAITVINGDIDLQGNPVVTSSPAGGEGNIYVNGSITLIGQSWVDNDATATGQIALLQRSGNAFPDFLLDICFDSLHS